MSGHPTAPHLEVLALLADEETLTTAQLADLMTQMRTTPQRRGAPRPIGPPDLMHRMAEQLLWRLAAQNLINAQSGRSWRITDTGRALAVSRAATVQGALSS
ncbi:hypothetical protein ETD83_27695 [Actinomadura soli]|uniref:Restriction system protein Mrr-like N-terminal domain-containing protein n=1 Tax=Actinomadura soli TaxID=2508997 RepID=A0A5C4J5G9_9ACTN|nr:hypothetical protein [Actinomadura soli]TMQ92212.1 hypothetical protein ETD83_27695 [Actinomadura soli]